MWRKAVYLYLFLCSIPIQCHESQELVLTNTLSRYVTFENVSQRNNYYQKTVRIEGIDAKVKLRPYDIVLNGHPTQLSNLDKTYAFYIFINCKISLWHIQRISNFIDATPLFFQYKFQNYDQYDKLYKLKFSNDLNSLIYEVKTIVVQFISILNNFLDIFVDSSFYMDNSVLKTLVSLKIKIDMMSIINYENPTYFNRSDNDIVQILLEEMNTLQRFLPMNCEYTPYEMKNSQLFGFWIAVNGEESEIENIISIVSNIYDTIDLNSVTKLQNCSIEKIFLENIVNMSSHDLVAIDIGNSIVKITKAETIKIKDLWYLMKKSFNIDVIVWYHDIILTALMKLIYYKASIEGQHTDESIKRIKEINKKISESGNDIPEYFVEGFERLKNLERDHTNWCSNLLQYADSIDNIQFSKSELINTESDESYFEMLLGKILNNFDDIKCAHGFLKNLRRENDKYFNKPGITSQLLSRKAHVHNEEMIESQYNKSTKACDLLLNMFKLSFRAHIDINAFEAASLAMSDDKKVKADFKEIKTVCFAIIKHETNNISLSKIAYNIATILENQRYDSQIKEHELLQFKRILNIIMSELNVYSLKYCSRSPFNYLLFNNINLSTSGNNILLQNSIRNLIVNRYNISIGIENDTITSTEDLQYIKINDIYEIYVKNNLIFEYYEDNIKFHWKRQQQSVKYIFLDAMEMTLDPQLIYTLYDIYFKFYIAAVYYEMQNVLTENSYKNLKTKLNSLNDTLQFFDSTFFPNELSSFIINLKELLSIASTLEQTVENNEEIEESKVLSVIKIKESAINKQLKKYNLTILINKTDNFKRLRILTQLSLRGITPVSLLNYELSSKINDVNNLRKKFKDDIAISYI